MLKIKNFLLLIFGLIFIGFIPMTEKTYSTPISVFSKNSLIEDEKLLYTNEWVKSGEDYYYYGEDGKMYKNKWVSDENADWYYLGADGKMQRSKWIEEKYYVDENGKMIKNAVKEFNGKTYLFDNNGVATLYVPETQVAVNSVNKSYSSYGNSYSGSKSIKKTESSDGGYYYAASGKCYHMKKGCSGAYLTSPPKNISYRPCSKCCY